MADTRDPLLPLPAQPSQNVLVAAGIIVAIGALYVGAGIFVPLVLAVLLTFALAPIVRMLHRLHIPHVLAVLMTVAGAALVLGSLAFLIFGQLTRLAGELPQYQLVVSEKVRELQSLGGGDLFERLASGIQDIGARPGAVPLDAGAEAPIPVTVVAPPESPLHFAQMFLVSLLGPLTTAAIVTVFVVFLLLEHGDFRDRFLKLVSRGDLRTSTKVINEAGARVSRYLLVQFSVNMSYGLLFGTGLFFIGVPNPVLWGMIAALFRYIPFVGTLIAASIPFALAFAIDPGWGMLAGVLGLFVGLEMVVTNAVEPRLYGSSTGLSALAVIVAAMFWATLWGPIGLILSTPITVCLVVLGRYVPQLNFLEILLGSEPVLVREEQLYQRLLAGNVEEATELAENYIEENSVGAFFDDVAFPALKLAEADRRRNLTDVSSRRLVADGMAALVRELDSAGTADGDTPPEGPLRVLCIGGRTELDGAAANMLAQVFAGPGVTTAVLPPISVRSEGLPQLDLDGIDVVCLAYLDANPRTYARFVARRLKRRDESVRVLAFLPNAPALAEPEAIDAANLDGVVTTGAAARRWVAALARADGNGAPAPQTTTPPPREDWPLRLRRFVNSGAPFDEMVAGITARFDCEMTIVSPAEAVVPESEDGAVRAGRARDGVSSLTSLVVAKNAPLVIEDAAQDPDHAQNNFLLVNDIRFYAGVPLRDDAGVPVGTLSIMATAARKFRAEEIAALENTAAELVQHLPQDTSPREAAALAG